MAVNSYSHHLVAVPKSWKSYFKLKPGCEYKDVLKMELQFWKINALYRGYLMRKAERKRPLQKDWVSCYTVISANLVLLFKDCKQSTNKPLEYVTLSPHDTVTVLVETNEKHKFCFAIKTAHKDDRDWVFSASSPDERTMWVAALEAIFDFMNHGRITKWSLKQLEKEKPFMRDPQTEDGKETLKHDYTDITDKEICAEDVEIYDSVQPDEKWNDLQDKELSVLAGKFGNQWKAFAREELLLIQSEIECIEGKNRHDLKEQMFDALVRWRRKQDGSNTKAKLIELLKNSSYCDPEAWLCLEKPGSYGYVTWKQERNRESSSHTYYNVTSGKQTMQPFCSRSLSVTNTPGKGTREAPTSDGQSLVKVPFCSRSLNVTNTPDKDTRKAPTSDGQSLVKVPFCSRSPNVTNTPDKDTRKAPTSDGQSLVKGPVCSRSLNVTNTPGKGTRKAPTSDGQSPVKGHDQNTKWEVVTAEMKQELRKRPSV
ncbi:hypothetical protein HOLleu_33827 [Holothuria leucospilota]|uniref:PH domain-containing protein n=1 Tax=Holothuria leucospilota TaxID=206669 RepID=A0A9Q1BHF9_HOLLE|nr:hypothetical protein HOLleu_33827 [Holothuria leucospilota]